MHTSLTTLVSAYPAVLVPGGTVLLRRGEPVGAAIYVESGRILLGTIGQQDDVQDGFQIAQSVLEHQLGAVEAPGWLEVNAVVLNLPSAVDALAETDLVLRRVPIKEFGAVLANGSLLTQAVLHDIARAHRLQTELAVSRLAKDAEARCAEWLLRHAESTDKGVCSVKLQQRKRTIAAQLGIAPETLSRVLRHLRERSLISGSGRTLNLVDPGGLRSLAER